MRLFIIILLYLFINSACEETLEVCPPCGKIEDGDQEIVGDIRIDLTFRAIQNFRQEINNIADRFQFTINELNQELEIEKISDENALMSFLEFAKNLFSHNDIEELRTKINYGYCYVDSNLANQTQKVCEQRLCNISRNSNEGFCRGISKGICKKFDIGKCITKSDNTCVGKCIGICSNVVDFQCYGTCFGSCDDACDNYDKGGICSGNCFGNCTGYCEDFMGFECPTICEGYCEIVSNENSCSENETFYGICNEVTENNLCLGNYYPKGCGDNCSSCIDFAADCREISKLLAWSKIDCSPSYLQISANIKSDFLTAFKLDSQIRIIENGLENILTDYAKLLSLVEGIEVSSNESFYNELNNSLKTQLDDSIDKIFTINEYEGDSGYKIDTNKKLLPLETLKARIEYFQKFALDSSGGFRISAGTYDCLEPALKNALEILLNFSPVKYSNEINSYVRDESCNSLNRDSNLENICVYELLNNMRSVLNSIE